MSYFGSWEHYGDVMKSFIGYCKIWQNFWDKYIQYLKEVK